MGARAVRGSDAARRLTALLLETWSGVRTTLSASEAMGVTLPRFYQLEARALQTMVTAMEPRPRGRPRAAEDALGKLQAERQRLLRDVERYQSLYRTAQRALGVTVARPQAKAHTAAPGGKRRRGPRKKARGQAVAAVLLGTATPAAGMGGVGDGTTEQGPGARGPARGRSTEQAAPVRDPGHADGAAVRGRGL
jgi:hypothetical protein